MAAVLPESGLKAHELKRCFHWLSFVVLLSLVAPANAHAARPGGGGGGKVGGRTKVVRPRKPGAKSIPRKHSAGGSRGGGPGPVVHTATLWRDETRAKEIVNLLRTCGAAGEAVLERMETIQVGPDKLLFSKTRSGTLGRAKSYALATRKPDGSVKDNAELAASFAGLVEKLWEDSKVLTHVDPSWRHFHDTSRPIGADRREREILSILRAPRGEAAAKVAVTGARAQ